MPLEVENRLIKEELRKRFSTQKEVEELPTNRAKVALENQ
jgi:hypothetical protein